MIKTCIYVERCEDGSPVPFGPLPEGFETEEIEVEIHGSVAPIVRGRFNGPSEDCYPDEGGEVEDIEASVDGKPFELTDEETQKAEEALVEAAADQDDGDYEDDYEDRYDPRCDD